ncbi:MAG: signal peptidase I [bacterium]
MNTKPKTSKSSVKPHKGRVFRNIWLVSIIIFVLSLVGMMASVVTDKNGSFDAVGIFTLILVMSAVVGSISFLIWIFKIGNKFMKAIILALAGLFLFLIFVRSLVRYAIVDGNSMEPSFKHNEIYLVNKMSYKIASPLRGEVVSYTLSDGVGEYMGRVVGLPNEIGLYCNKCGDISAASGRKPSTSLRRYISLFL